MRFFDWIKAKWQGVNKDPPDATIYLAFMSNGPCHEIKCANRYSQENLLVKQAKKRKSFRRTLKRGIERRRVIVNRFDEYVDKFVNECLIFDPSFRTEKIAIYDEYLDWAKKHHVSPRKYQSFFAAMNASAKDKPIYVCQDQTKTKKMYGGIGLKSYFMIGH